MSHDHNGPIVKSGANAFTSDQTHPASPSKEAGGQNHTRSVSIMWQTLCQFLNRSDMGKIRERRPKGAKGL